MSKLITTAATIFAFAAAPQAFAAFTKAQVIEATQKAVDAFDAANPTHSEHFTGFKSWKSGEDAKVKIYVTHDGHNMEFNYLCHIHDEGIECHAQ